MHSKMFEYVDQNRLGKYLIWFFWLLGRISTALSFRFDGSALARSVFFLFLPLSPQLSLSVEWLKVDKPLNWWLRSTVSKSDI